MAIVFETIDKQEFQSHRTRETGKAKYDDFLAHVLNMEDDSYVRFSHEFTNDEGETITAEHSEKGNCPIVAHIMNQRGKLGLRKGMFRSTHDDDGNLEVYRTPVPVQNDSDAE